jgi:peptidoglycan-associated lipoprotein
MKLNKMILPLALALVATLATTGCRHSTTKLTKLPGQRTAGTGDSDISGTKPFGDGGTGTGVNGVNGANNGNDVNSHGIPQNQDLKDLSKFNQDRATLAADTVHFDYDSAVVKDKEQSHLANVAQALSSDSSAFLLIEGHCDERGTEEYNRALGVRRADSLREALAHNGVDAQRITTISYGKDRKVDLGNSDAAHAKNRRGEFVLLHAK